MAGRLDSPLLPLALVGVLSLGWGLSNAVELSRFDRAGQVVQVTPIECEPTDVLTDSRTYCKVAVSPGVEARVLYSEWSQRPEPVGPPLGSSGGDSG